MLLQIRSDVDLLAPSTTAAASSGKLKFISIKIGSTKPGGRGIRNNTRDDAIPKKCQSHSSLRQTLAPQCLKAGYVFAYVLSIPCHVRCGSFEQVPDASFAYCLVLEVRPLAPSCMVVSWVCLSHPLV